MEVLLGAVPWYMSSLAMGKEKRNISKVSATILSILDMHEYQSSHGRIKVS